MPKLHELIHHVIAESTEGRAVKLTQQDRAQLLGASNAASALVDKLADGLTWRDRHIAFDEWRALSDVLDGKTD